MTTAEQHDARTGSSRWQTSIRWIRIIPVALIMYTIAFIDRTNISLALPHISRDLHLDPQQAGTVAGIFFWGYLALQIPGGHLAKHWSAKKFISVLLLVYSSVQQSGFAEGERVSLLDSLRGESSELEGSENITYFRALLGSEVYLLAAIYFCFFRGHMELLYSLPSAMGKFMMLGRPS